MTDTPSTVSKMDQIARSNRWAAWRWGSLVIGLLGMQVLLGAVAITLATNDDSAAVVPDYYEKAMRWDDEVDLQNASQALGWDLVVEPFGLQSDAAGLAMTLTDRQHNAVEIQTGTVRWYHHARASDLQTVSVAASKQGRVRFPDCFDQTGWWQVEVDVRDTAGNRFVHSQAIQVRLGEPPAGSPAPPRGA